MQILIKKNLKKIGLWKMIKKGRDFYYNHRNKKTHWLGSDGSASLPQKATIELTVKCNLNCKMCPQKEERQVGLPDYTFNDFYQILNNLGKRIKLLSFIGGEIFVHSGIFKMLEECQRRKIKVHLSTNATLFNQERINQLKKFKNIIQGIGTSIDGLEKIHNSIRGSQIAFQRTSQALKDLTNDFNLSVNTVLFKENLDELLEVVEMFKNQGLQNFSWQFEVFAPQKEILDSSQALDIPLSKMCVEEKPSQDYDFEHQKIQELLKRVRRIKGISFMVQPRLYDKYPKLYFDGQLREQVALRCKDIFACRIDSRGNVIFCPAIKIELGNLLEHPIQEIWNNQEFKDLRLKMMQNNLTPICKRCCRLGLK